MAFVEHHQAEAAAQVLHVQVGRVVGRDRERLHVVVAAADDADLGCEGGAQSVVPLAHQIQGRRDDQRAALAVVDGHVRDQGLARPGRQHDDAAETGGLPGGQGAGLVGARLAMHQRPRARVS
jgi:hypothetical protein